LQRFSSSQDWPHRGPSPHNKKPDIVILMTDDTGWNDFGAYGGGENLGHPTPNVDKVAQEGALSTHSGKVIRNRCKRIGESYSIATSGRMA
jgi:hypothetical protein